MARALTPGAPQASTGESSAWSRPGVPDPGLTGMAAQRLGALPLGVHRLRGLPVFLALPAALRARARRQRPRADRALVGTDRRRHAGHVGAAGASLRTSGRSLRAQDDAD